MGETFAASIASFDEVIAGPFEVAASPLAFTRSPMLPSDRQILPNEGRPQVIHPFGVSLLQDVDDLKAPFRQRNHDVLPDGAQQPQQHAFLTTRSSLPAPGSSCNYSLERITAGVNFAVLAGVLGVLNMYVVAGNMLIILAVLLFAKLRRSRTNTFIVSLAFSDFMLGLLVLPFSTTNMMLEKHWIFGDIWCSGWLGIDVLLCTVCICVSSSINVLYIILSLSLFSYCTKLCLEFQMVQF